MLKWPVREVDPALRLAIWLLG